MQWTEQDKEKMIMFHERRWTWSEIANHFNRPLAEVKRIGEELGLVVKREASIWYEERKLRLIQLLDDGMTYRQCAEALGVSQNAIAHATNKLKLEGYKIKPRVVSTPWTDEDDEKLKAMAKSGLSASAIAKELSHDKIKRSRSSVLGRCHRIGVKIGATDGDAQETKRTVTKKKIAKKTAAPKAIPAPKLKPIPQFKADNKYKSYRAAFQANGAKTVSFDELNSCHCRWPIDGPNGEIRYCGKPKEHESYCRHHAEIAFPAIRAKAKASDSEAA